MQLDKSSQLQDENTVLKAKVTDLEKDIAKLLSEHQETQTRLTDTK